VGLGRLRAGGGGGERVAILLSDQAYPPAWPASGPSRCLAILRVENGTLHELAMELLRRVRGSIIEAGSIIMLFSATHLALSGTAAYCEDLVNVIVMLKKEMGEHLWYTAMPHFFSGGCQDEITIRLAVEVNAWACNTFGRERVYLKNTSEAANEILCENGDGGRQAPAAVRYWLPGGLAGGAPPAVWMSGGVVLLPRAVKPAQLVQERYLYRTLVAELRGGLAIDLEPSPDFDRGIRDVSGPVASGGGGERYLVIGSSNARRLHEALTESGKVAELVYLDQLRIIRSTGELIKAKICEAVAKESRQQS
jgi:hypothetical protein